MARVGTDPVLLSEYLKPLTDGAFPTVLAECVREEGRLTLEDAIRKITSTPALLLDIRDRRMLHEGMKPDIVVFNPNTVKSPATRSHFKQLPVGIGYVVVNGAIVVSQGQHTGT